MDEEQLRLFNLGLGSAKFKNDRDFLRFVSKHIDIDLLRTNPFIWQDIWVFNYLTYDFKKPNFDRKGLLAKYSNEILAPQENLLKDAREILRMLEQ